MNVLSCPLVARPRASRHSTSSRVQQPNPVRMRRHPRDISESDLAAMLALTPYPEALRELVACGREQAGFFPAHNPRALEYPWVLANVPAPLDGLRILDVGAGVNPLPFALAQRGASVVTLDNHP